VFIQIESQREIAEAQRSLVNVLHKELDKRLRRNIGYPGGTRGHEIVHANKSYWVWSMRLHDASYPRWLNWFGQNPENGMLEISVEINVPLKGAVKSIAGWFGIDSRTGATHLFHSGRVGGGTRGVSREPFLAWRNKPLESTVGADGATRLGVSVMVVDDSRTIDGLFRYIDEIAAFKKAVREGLLGTAAFKRQFARFKDYYSEASGVRKVKRSAEVEYITRHGDVVDALHSWRTSHDLPVSSRLVKDILIDLGVAIGAELLELYEVKTSADRTSIYAAIGQLLVHGQSDNCRRVVVLPQGEVMASDLIDSLSRLKIETRYFKLKGRSAVILD
jgi:hypothetical protein